MNTQRNFRRDLLPLPLDYYRKEGLKLLGRGDWRSALCPFHDDVEPSFRVHTPNGGFFCHGCGAKGGDVLDFHRRRYSLGFVEAAKELGAWEVIADQQRRSSRKHSRRAVDPVKQAARRLAQTSLEEGYEPEALHEYRDERGQPLFWVIRVRKRKTGKKKIRPMYFNGRWYVLGEPKFAIGKPLYNLDLLASHRHETVVVCEGEKCADALVRRGVLATTSPFGAKAASAANWQPLTGRNVLIWPDHDEPGNRYAADATELLQRLGCSVRVIDTSRLELSDGEDAFDWLARNEKVGPEDILRLATTGSSHADLPAAAALHAIGRWRDARCRRDVRVMGAIPVLYRDYCAQYGAKQTVTPAGFVAGLTALGEQIDKGFAKGFALTEDVLVPALEEVHQSACS